MKILNETFEFRNNRNRKFYTIECPVCKSIDKVRSDATALRQPMCRQCRGFAPITSDKVNSLEDFKRHANTIHKNLYTYDYSNYIKASIKTIVTCAIHGNFLVSPNNHLKGKGCPKCALTKRGWNRSLYKNKPTSLYYAIIDNTYYKIGISKQGERYRYYKDRSLGRIVDIVFEVWFFNGEHAYDIEKELLLATKDTTINIDILVHGGNSEIRTVDFLPDVKNIVRRYNEIN